MILIMSVFESELDPVQESTVSFEEKEIFQRHVMRGLLGRNEVVLTSGIFGKVESAYITQKLLDEYEVKNIFLVSGAGAMTDETEIGSVILGEAFHEYDKILRKGEKNPAVAGDLELIKDIKSNYSKVRIGKIISGDRILENKEVRDDLYNRYRALALDMDSAVIAKVAKANDCSFVSIKVILDKSDGKTQQDFNDNYERYSSIPGAILADYLSKHFIG